MKYTTPNSHTSLWHDTKHVNDSENLPKEREGIKQPRPRSQVIKESNA